MITLEQIVSSNLEMLKEQEASLLKSLAFIRKARQLFESQNHSGVQTRTRTRPKGRKKRSVPAKVASSQKTTTKAQRSRAGGNHLDRIIALLKEKKNPMSSRELLDGLFKQQTVDKDKKHFGTLIYPVLSKAYKSGKLKLKEGKIHLIS